MVVTELLTFGDEFGFTTYDSDGLSKMTVVDVKRDVGAAARIVLLCDRRPRKTFVFHREP